MACVFPRLRNCGGHFVGICTLDAARVDSRRDVIVGRGIQNRRISVGQSRDWQRIHSRVPAAAYRAAIYIVPRHRRRRTRAPRQRHRVGYLGRGREIHTCNVDSVDWHTLTNGSEGISCVTGSYRVDPVCQCGETVVARAIGNHAAARRPAQRHCCSAPTRRRTDCARNAECGAALRRGCKIDSRNISAINRRSLRVWGESVARVARAHRVGPIGQPAERIPARGICNGAGGSRPTQHNRCSASTYYRAKCSRDTKGESCRRKTYSRGNARIVDCYVHAARAEAIPRVARGDRICSVG